MVVCAVSIFLFLLLLCAVISVVGYGLFGDKGVSCDRLEKMDIIAHRGGEYDLLPENSVGSINRALASGVKIVEVDVRITKDGELVVFHDAELCEKTDGKGKVSEMLLEELRLLRLKNRNGVIGEERLPSLGDVLWAVNGKSRLLIDAKCVVGDEERFAKALINEIALYQAAGWVSVQSFSDELLSHLHRLGHPFPLEKLFVFKFPYLPFAYDKGITCFSFEKYDYISSFNFYCGTLSPSLVAKIHSMGKKVKVWTPAAPDAMPALCVDGVITDNPENW